MWIWHDYLCIVLYSANIVVTAVYSCVCFFKKHLAGNVIVFLHCSWCTGTSGKEFEFIS